MWSIQAGCDEHRVTRPAQPEPIVMSIQTTLIAVSAAAALMAAILVGIAAARAQTPVVAGLAAMGVI